MNMKAIKLSLIALVAILMAVPAISNAQVFSKKEDLKDLNSKTLMVVLENSSMINLTLKQAVEKEWELSKIAFCNLEEFEKIKTDSSYYFLVRVKGIFKKEREPSIEFLSLLKGGEEARMGLDEMYDVLSLPFQTIDDPDGYIIPYIDAYVNIIEAHVLRVQKHKIAATLGLGWYSNRLQELRNKTVLVNENDLSELITKEEANKILKDGGKVVEEDEIYDAIDNKKPKTAYTICIGPQVEQQGSYCYKMVISADSHDIFYYRKQKVNSKNPKGFLPEDIKKIALPNAIF
ncbi:MAG: hypothetical protein IKY70_02610 [Bacteroidales bacterium]|nr:hypothetical protein [Bacteroidales bacterium]